MPRRTKKKINTKSNQYEFTLNPYSWLNKDQSSDIVVNSLLTSAPFSYLENDLKILSELDEYRDLGFDLLVQRDVDDIRVNVELVSNYLDKGDKRNFFPPIVTILIPTYSSKIKDKVVSHYKFNNDTKELEITINTDEIEVSLYYPDESDEYEDLDTEFNSFFEQGYVLNGELSWNTQRFNAIIIDGQHRFSALNKFISNNKLDKEKCHVPINFILLQPHINNVNVAGEKFIQIAREFFIDINNNMKNVSDSRLILLDDRDLYRSAVRHSIRQYNVLNHDEFYAWETINGVSYLNRIPQEIVSWSESASDSDQNINLFKLAQLTSTSLLYRLFKDFILPYREGALFDAFFKVYELDDYEFSKEHEKKIENYLSKKKNSFEKRLNELIDEEKDEKERDPDYDKSYFEYEKTKLKQNALKFEPWVNEWLNNWFFDNCKIGKFITIFYSTFSPYREVIDTISKYFEDIEKYSYITSNLVDPKEAKLSKYLVNIPNEDIKSEFTNLFKELEEQRKKFYDIRLTVFQRAIISNLNDVFAFLDDKYRGKSVEEKCISYIQALSDLYKKGAFEREKVIKLSSPLFNEATDQKYSLSEIKVWEGVWFVENSMGNTMIKYRDLDAFKIGDYIRVLVSSLGEDKTYSTLVKEDGPIPKAAKSVFKTLKSTYLKKIQYYLELANQTEVKEILDMDKFDNDIKKIIDTFLKSLN